MLKSFINFIIGRSNSVKISLPDFKFATTRADLGSEQYDPEENPFIERKRIFKDILNFLMNKTMPKTKTNTYTNTGSKNTAPKNLLLLADVGFGKTRLIMEFIKQYWDRSLDVDSTPNKMQIKFIYYFFKFTGKNINEAIVTQELIEFINNISLQIKFNLNIDIDPIRFYNDPRNNTKYNDPSIIQIVQFLNQLKIKLKETLLYNKNHLYCLIFDGLNELIYTENKTLQHLAETLMRFQTNEPNIRIILTSQPISIKKDIRTNLKILNLTDGNKYEDDNKSAALTYIKDRIIPLFGNITEEKKEQLQNTLLDHSHFIMAYFVGIRLQTINDEEFKSKIIRDPSLLPENLIDLYKEYLLALRNNEHVIKLLSAIYYMEKEDLIPFLNLDMLKFAGIIDENININDIQINTPDLPLNFIIEKHVNNVSNMEYDSFILNYHFKEFLEDNLNNLSKHRKVQTDKEEEEPELKFSLNNNEENTGEMNNEQEFNKILEKIRDSGKEIEGYLLMNLKVEEKEAFDELLKSVNIRGLNNSVRFLRNRQLKDIIKLWISGLYKGIYISIINQKVRVLVIKGISLKEEGAISISCFKYLKVLHLSENQLSSLPESIGDLKNLQTLSIHHNELSSLPESIGNLTNLQILDLRWNKLSSLPERIDNLKILKELDLGWNKLLSLPESIGQLTKLEHLSISGNKLSSLPEIITRMTWLKVLDIGGNQLSSLPESIGHLTNLELLWIADNQLSSLPEIITRMTWLKLLNIEGNQIPSLPESIGHLTNLELLWITDNQLSSIPESIQRWLEKLEKNGCVIWR